MLSQCKLLFRSPARKIASINVESATCVWRKSEARLERRCLSSVNYAVEEESISEQPLIIRVQEKGTEQSHVSHSFQHSLAEPELMPDIDTSSLSSPSILTYTGNTHYPITTELHIFKPGEDAPAGGCWPVFRLMVRYV